TLHYILSPNPLILADGPWTGASPKSYNATLFYETDTWQARVSAAYRGPYITQYPLQAGTCNPGVCDSPTINDFVGSKETLNVDASASWDVTKWASLTVDVLNITNQTSNRWAYQADPMVTSYASTGTQVFAGMRLTF